MIIIIVVLFILIISYLFRVFFELNKFCVSYRHLPHSDSSHFLFGDATILIKAILGLTSIPLHDVVFLFFNQLLKNHHDKDVAVFWLGWYPIVIVQHPDHVQNLLTSNDAIDKAPEYRYLHNWLGNGLLTSSRNRWRLRRHMLTSAFHFQTLRSFLPIIQEQTIILMDRLHRHANCEIDLFDFIPFAALDIICETAMGVRINAQSNPTNDYVRAVMSQSEIVFGRFLNPFMPDWWFNRTTLGRQEQKNIETLHRFTMEVIQQKMSNDNFNCSEASRKRFVFIDLLVNQYHNAKIEIEDIREEVDTFMFEGFDTTTSAISWIVFLLGHHPHCQKRLYDEIEEWWPLSASIPSIDSNCLAALKYLDACVKESLRLFPSVPIIGRRLSKSIQFGSYIVPKHATTIVYLYGLHRNGATFPQPNQFRPERFLGNANLNRAHSFGFLPFSAGQRNCIGQKLALLEIKLMILYLIRSFRIESLVALDQVSISVELVMRPKSKMAIRLIAR